MPRLREALTRLTQLHALNVLDGMILVIPVNKASDPRENWSLPLEHPRVAYIRPNSAPDIWQSAAAVITETGMGEFLQQNGFVDPNKVPVIWIGAPISGSAKGLLGASIDGMLLLADKLLCDERLRAAAAPEILYPIPLLRWIPCSDKKIRVLHLLAPGNVRGKSALIQRIAAHSRSVTSHSALYLGSCDARTKNALKTAGIKRVISSPATCKDWFQLLRRLCPDVLHLHAMNSVPQWLPIHRYLAEWNIVESEYEAEKSAGHFGAVDVVICQSAATKKTHKTLSLPWCDAAPKYEVAHGRIDGYYRTLYKRLLRMGQ